MTLERRKTPVGNYEGLPESTATDYPYLTALGLDPREPLTGEDRYELAVLSEAHAMGYTLATRCTRCNQWVVAPESVALHMGPVCRKRVADA